MRRPIKFRVWNGFGMHRPNEYEMLRFFGPNGDSWDVVYGLGDVESGHEKAVLLQFTGLTDANGVEIYEGDVVEYRSIRWVVEWDDGDAGIKLSDTETGELVSLGFAHHKARIIGNIYENPDLL